MKFPSLAQEFIDRIVGFLGYGRLSAPVWFIGLEEGLGRMNDEEAHCNLVARGRFDEVMDLAAAHKTLKETGKFIEIENKKSFSTQVWHWMAKVMLARAGYQNWNEASQVKSYIRTRLGRKTCRGETFLTELSPIPRKKNTEGRWIEYFRALDKNIDEKIRQRMIRLQNELSSRKPTLIICYGKRQYQFQQLLGIERWIGTSPILRSSNFQCLLLPFFGNGHMSEVIIKSLVSEGLLRGRKSPFALTS